MNPQDKLYQENLAQNKFNKEQVEASKQRFFDYSNNVVKEVTTLLKQSDDIDNIDFLAKFALEAIHSIGSQREILYQYHLSVDTLLKLLNEIGLMFNKRITALEEAKSYLPSQKSPLEEKNFIKEVIECELQLYNTTNKVIEETLIKYSRFINSEKKLREEFKFSTIEEQKEILNKKQ
jgi:hypothetical protein